MTAPLRRVRRRLGLWLLSFEPRRSDDYVPGSSGWAIDQYGNAEFNDVCIGGTCG